MTNKNKNNGPRGGKPHDQKLGISDPAMAEINRQLCIAAMGAFPPDSEQAQRMDYFGALCCGNYSVCVDNLGLSSSIGDSISSECSGGADLFKRANNLLYVGLRTHLGEKMRVCRIAEFILVLADRVTCMLGQTIFTPEEMVQAYRMESFGMSLARTISALNLLRRHEELMIPRFKFDNEWYYDLGAATYSKEARKERQERFDSLDPSSLALFAGQRYPPEVR